MVEIEKFPQSLFIQTRSERILVLLTLKEYFNLIVKSKCQNASGFWVQFRETLKLEIIDNVKIFWKDLVLCRWSSTLNFGQIFTAKGNQRINQLIVHFLHELTEKFCILNLRWIEYSIFYWLYKLRFALWRLKVTHVFKTCLCYYK